MTADIRNAIGTAGLSAVKSKTRTVIMAAVRSLYRRALRVAAACVPEQRSFAFTYVRGRFRDAAALQPGTHKYSERLSDGRDEVDRMVRLLNRQKRLSDESAARLLAAEPSRAEQRDAVSSVRQAASTSSTCMDAIDHEAQAPIPPSHGAVSSVRQVASTSSTCMDAIDHEAQAPITPSQPIRWDERDVAAWLTDLGLSVHAPAFADSRVNGRLLLSLDDEDLQELGVASRLQRKLILTRCEAIVDATGRRSG
jgi:hypothetical protein